MNFLMKRNVGFAMKRTMSIFPLSKIVATIGPASEQLHMLTPVVNAGLNIMRINFSHATYEEGETQCVVFTHVLQTMLIFSLVCVRAVVCSFEFSITTIHRIFVFSAIVICACHTPHSVFFYSADLRSTNLRKIQGVDKSLNGQEHNLRAIMLDTQGPEIRTGSFNQKNMELIGGNTVILTTDDSVRHHQSENKIWISYKKILDTVSEGSSILLDDGAIEVIVKSKCYSTGELTCLIQNSGTLGNKKGTMCLCMCLCVYMSKWVLNFSLFRLNFCDKSNQPLLRELFYFQLLNKYNVFSFVCLFNFLSCRVNVNMNVIVIVQV